MTTLKTENARVLVADDDEFSQNIARQLLSMMDIKARLVNSGALALKAVEQGKYDMVFIDHVMPEMDGIETMKKIRALGGKYEDIVLVALTGIIGDNARATFIDQGFTDYLSKPLDGEALCEVVEKYLPAEKIIGGKKNDTQASAPLNDKAYSDGDLKMIGDFLRDKEGAAREIKEQLNSGDFEKAHRTAHNLKNASGYFGKKSLQAAAQSLEDSLGNTKPEFTSSQIVTLEEKLLEALSDFRLILANTEAEIAPTKRAISDETLNEILENLKPLLVASDFQALEYVDQLRTHPKMKAIAEMIENYDFEDAYIAIYETSTI